MEETMYSVLSTKVGGENRPGEKSKIEHVCFQILQHIAVVDKIILVGCSLQVNSIVKLNHSSI